MPISDRATQDMLLRHIVSRLRVKVPHFTEATCFLCDQVTPLAWPAGSLCCTVTLTGGRFPEAFYAGGGPATLCKQAELAVTPWVRCNLESLPAMEQVLTNQEVGLWSRWEAEILRALLLETDGNGVPQCWMPLGPDGLGLLRSCLSPLGVSAVRPDNSGEWLGMTITFHMEFDWRL